MLLCCGRDSWVLTMNWTEHQLTWWMNPVKIILYTPRHSFCFSCKTNCITHRLYAQQYGIWTMTLQKVLKCNGHLCLFVAASVMLCGSDLVGTQMRTGKFRTTNLQLVHELDPGHSELFIRASGTVPSPSSVWMSESRTRLNSKHSRMKLLCCGNCTCSITLVRCMLKFHRHIWSYQPCSLQCIITSHRASRPVPFSS